MAEARFDFYNPFMTAIIETPDGKRFPLWLQTNSTDRAAARLSDDTVSLPFLQELTVEIQLAYLPIIKATLTPPYRDAINFLDSTLIEWGQSVLEVNFGYIIGDNAVLSPLPYRGILFKPEVQLGQDIVITLTAQGVGGFAAAKQEANETINNATRREIVQKLAAPFKLEVNDDAVKKAAEADAVDAAVLAQWDKVKLPTFTQGGDSYWTAILRVVHEAGLLSYLFGSELRVLPPSTVFSDKPTKLFRLYDFSNGTLGPVAGGLGGPNQVFPILSASSPTMAIYMPSSSRGYFIQDVNSFDREEIHKFIGEEETAPARTGEGNASQSNPANGEPEANKQTGAGAEMFPGDPSDDQLIAQVKAEYGAQTTLMGVQLTLESLGDPTLFPGTVIAVRGLGARLNGNYAVLKVTHTLGSSGYTMSLECVSNVGRALENAKKALGPVAPEPDIDESGGLEGSVVVDPGAI